MLLSFLARRSESRTTCPWWWRCIAPTQPVVIVEIVWFEWWQTHILQKAKWYHIYKRYMQGPDLRHMFKVEKHDSNGPHEEGWYCFIGSCLDSAIYIYIKCFILHWCLLSMYKKKSWDHCWKASLLLNNPYLQVFGWQFGAQKKGRHSNIFRAR